MNPNKLFIDTKPGAFSEAHAAYLETQADYVRVHGAPHDAEASNTAVERKVAAQSTMYAVPARSLDQVLVKIRDFMAEEAPGSLDDCQRRLLGRIAEDIEDLASGRRYLSADAPEVVALRQRVG